MRRLRAVLLIGATIMVWPMMLAAQGTTATPDWQSRAGGKMAFEVATVRPSKPDTFTPPNFALSPDDAFIPDAHTLSADFPLSAYIGFAYKLWLTREQEHTMFATLPKWVSTEHFTIHAETDHPVTKDQMRLMVQTLLAERFKLAVHFETRDTPVLAMVLERTGVMGPKLRPHAGDTACDAPPKPIKGDVKKMSSDEIPFTCNFSLLSRPGHVVLLGSRNATLSMIANSLPSVSRLDRPVVDETGLSGHYDFTLEWLPNDDTVSGSSEDVQGVSFQEALKEQLGVKLKATHAPLQVLVIDHIEEPTPN